MAENGESCRLLEIPDKLCEEIGCKAAWGLGNQLFVYAGNRPKQSGEAAALSSGRPCDVHEVVWDTEMQDPISRKLVNETQDIFLKVQQQANDSSAVTASQMVQVSRQYRSVIQACSMELKQCVERCPSDAESVQLEAKLELFEVIELVWSLAEVLFIDAVPAGVVLNHLLDWLRIHFTDGTRLAQEAMQEQSPEQHASYWDAIYILVLQGRLDDARYMLSLHSKKETELFIILDRLMHRMPVVGANPGQSIIEFEMRWRHWQEECTQILEEGTFAGQRELETICKILCGLEDIYSSPEVVELLGSWYCLLISKLLYQNPTVKMFDLQYHTQACIEACGGHSTMRTWDNIVLAAIEYDIHQVIEESSTVLGNWWFVAHLTDLLQHCGKLESQTLSFGSNLREFLLLEYASSLLSHESLWQVGVNYLDHCEEFGRYYLEQFIEHLPLGSEKKTQKVLRICEKRDMQDQIRSICKVKGMEALHHKRLGSALSWALRSKDEKFAAVVAEKLLFEYHESGGFSSIDLLDNLGSSMLLSNQLTFLGKYREFHKLYEDREFVAAASLLLNLLTAKIAPKKIWPTLLMDALPLLEADQVIFSSQQTYELMHCVEHLDMEKRQLVKEAKAKPINTPENSKDTVSNNMESEKMALMRLALARNLARAIVSEGTVI